MYLVLLLGIYNYCSFMECLRPSYYYWVLSQFTDFGGFIVTHSMKTKTFIILLSAHLTASYCTIVPGKITKCSDKDRQTNEFILP